MLYTKKKGFTLLELIIAVVIIGILVAIGLPSYTGMKEQEHDRDANANLKLIMAAQRIYRMESSAYNIEDHAGGSEEAINPNTTQNIDHINTLLRLSLPGGNTRTWNYRAVANNGVLPPTTCVESNRTPVGRTGATRNLRLRNTETEPVSGACP